MTTEDESPLLLLGVKNAMNSSYSSNITKSSCSVAERIIKRRIDQSNLLCQPQNFSCVRKLIHKDVFIGTLLGTGGFNAIYNVKCCFSKKTERMNQTSDGDEPVNTIGEPEEEESSSSNKANEFALKCLRKKTITKKEWFISSAVDLAMEAKYLSNFHHKNIVRIHAVSELSVLEAFQTEKTCGYFFIMEKLPHTLTEKLISWRKEEEGERELSLSHLRIFRILRSKKSQTTNQHPQKHNSRQNLMKQQQQKYSLLVLRLCVALDIANALDYLHSRNIMYRDLKANNVGLTRTGIAKLFDFGLVKEIIPEKKPTGMAGTLKYMAPEVANKQYYNQSADVYSFAVLLWQICSMSIPFEQYSSRKVHRKEVIDGKKRPRIPSTWPIKIQQLISCGWNHEAQYRPVIGEIVTCLQCEIEKNQTYI